MKKIIMIALLSFVGCGNLDALNRGECVTGPYLNSLYEKYKNVHECASTPDLMKITLLCNKDGASDIYLTTEYVSEDVQITYVNNYLLNVAGDAPAAPSCIKEMYPGRVPAAKYDGFCSATYKRYCL